LRVVIHGGGAKVEEGSGREDLHWLIPCENVRIGRVKSLSSFHSLIQVFIDYNQVT
jgi:hypothetical protein